MINGNSLLFDLELLLGPDNTSDRIGGDCSCGGRRARPAEKPLKDYSFIGGVNYSMNGD